MIYTPYRGYTHRVYVLATDPMDMAGKYRVQDDQVIVCLRPLPRNIWVEVDHNVNPTAVVGIHVRNADNTAWLPLPTGSGSSYAPDSPDAPPGSANAMDDQFDDGSGMSGSTNGLNARWSWINQGGASYGFQNNGLLLSAPANSGDSVRMLGQTVPAGSWEFQAKICSTQADRNDIFTNYGHGGLFVRYDSGKLLLLGPAYESGEGIRLSKYTSASAFSSQLRLQSTSCIGRLVYLRLTYVSGTTTVKGWYSWSGLDNTWLGIEDEVVSSMTEVGIYAAVNNAATGWKTMCSWFRRIS